MKIGIMVFDNSSAHCKDRRDFVVSAQSNDCGRAINEITKTSLCLPRFFCNLSDLGGELLRFLLILTVLLLTVFSAKILSAEQEGAGKSPDKSQVLTPKLEKEEFIQKTKKLHIPFIANKGQTDAKVAFYANTFGGAVFVTKDGDIVYSLPSGRDVPGGASQEAGRGWRQGFGGELHSPDHALASLTHSPKGDVLCRVLE